jgi:co-chaperonin GroES (HSP10)
MEAIKGTLRPLHDSVLAIGMNFDEQVTAGGIILKSDDGKSSGVKPRWCQVWAIGPKQQDVKIGEWIYVEHGRWSRGVKVEQANGTEVTVRRIDIKAIMLQSDERPEDLATGNEITPSTANETYRI